MDYHIFHSTQVEASRDLIAALGGDPVNTGAQALSVNGDAITVIGHHAQNVAINPNIPGYPYVVFKNGDQDVGLFAPADWAEVKAWVAPEVETVISTTMSKYTFARRFTGAERKAILTASTSDVELQDARNLLEMAQDVDLGDTNVQNYIAYLVTAGHLTQARATEILAP